MFFLLRVQAVLKLEEADADAADNLAQYSIRYALVSPNNLDTFSWEETKG